MQSNGTLGKAASIAVIVTISILLNAISVQSAFAQVIQNIRAATDARYTLTQNLGKQPPMTSESSFSGGIARTEIPGQFVYLANTQTRETLQLIPSQRVAIKGNAGGNPMNERLSVPDIMKEMTEDNGELIETIPNKDGGVSQLYRVTKLPAFMGKGNVPTEDGFKVWVDSSTKLPTRIKIQMTIGPANSPVELDSPILYGIPSSQPVIST